MDMIYALMGKYFEDGKVTTQKTAKTSTTTTLLQSLDTLNTENFGSTTAGPNGGLAEPIEPEMPYNLLVQAPSHLNDPLTVDEHHIPAQ